MIFFCIKLDLALNNIQRLICHKTQTTNMNKNTSLGKTKMASEEIDPGPHKY